MSDRTICPCCGLLLGSAAHLRENPPGGGCHYCRAAEQGNWDVADGPKATAAEVDQMFDDYLAAHNDSEATPADHPQFGSDRGASQLPDQEVRE